MVIKLYIDYNSQPSRAVLALCLISNIPHQVIETSLMTGAQRSKEFVKINPMRRVPAIVDTDNWMALSESHSILKYLAQKYKVDQQWYPSNDLPKRAKIDQFLDFHHLSTRRCSYLAFHLLFAPIVGFGDPTFNQKYAEKTVREALKNFEKIYLKASRFIGGQKACIGDLVAFYDITMLEVLDYDFSPYTVISKWLVEMRKIEGVQKADVKFQQSKEGIKQLKIQNEENAAAQRPKL